MTLTALKSALPNLLVRPLQPNPHGPSRNNRSKGEAGIRTHADDISRAVAFGVQVGRVDVRSICDDVDNGQTHALLLTSLPERCGHPAKDDAVDRIRAAGEEEARNVAGGRIQRRARDDETDQCRAHTGGDMPSALVVAARRDADEDAECARDKVGRAGEHQRDGAVEAERLDHCWKEVVESACGQVHVLHEAEEVQAGVANSLHEACTWSAILLCRDSIAQDASVCKLTLLRCEPASVERVVGKCEQGQDRDTECDAAFDDEQPTPSSQTVRSVDGVEHGRRDETGERSGEDVA